ncbi:2,3-dimethylmalate lyase-like isoform X1 [Zingiber officinale]|uniref:2,3-dimethylmalate lyase-like isoform X1 n=1 Tax=Zingiber officinale TaxID=94328 RepID=UPI001C4A8FBB|nr:2,3-dimethylmalate lyase-like isoform X1 [Zingiber officinale]
MARDAFVTRPVGCESSDSKERTRVLGGDTNLSPNWIEGTKHMSSPMGLSSVLPSQPPPATLLCSLIHSRRSFIWFPSPWLSSRSLTSQHPLPSVLLPRRGPSVRKPTVRTAVVALASDGDSAAKALRKILETPGIHQGPACFDALSARLVERAGFQFCFMSGFSVSAAHLGLPDVGLISYGEMVDQGLQITQAVSIPVIGDGDNGYGNAMNVKRTVKGFIQAGFAGIIIEDQVSPKACGHTHGRKVVSREEAVMRIKAAIDARKESGSDIVIVARTDSRQAVSFEESLRRSRAFADVGADVLFIDALASREEMKALCDISPLLPKMANMLEGGGKTPILNPVELEQLGFRIVIYPLSLIGVSIRAMEDALAAIKSGRLPPPGSLPSFDEIKDTLGFNDYYEEEKRYNINPVQPSYQIGTEDSPRTTTGYRTKLTTQEVPQQNERTDNLNEPVVEVVTPYVYDNYSSGYSRSRQSGIWSRTLRLKITGRDGLERLDVRIPAGFLEGMARVIPGLGGIDIMQMLEDASVDGGTERGKILLDFNDAIGDRIQVFVE